MSKNLYGLFKGGWFINNRGRIVNCLLLITVILSLVSISWHGSSATVRPDWALWFAGIAICTGILFIPMLIFRLVVDSPIWTLADTGGGEEFKLFLRVIPEAKVIAEGIMQKLESKELIPGTPHFDGLMKEVREDFHNLMGKYKPRRLAMSLMSPVKGMLSAIVLFGFVYIAEFTVQPWAAPDSDNSSTCVNSQTHDAVEGGMTGTCTSKHGILSWVAEGIYFSTVTFATLGYGDIHPTQSILARSIAILEILSSMAIVLIVLQATIAGMQVTDMVDVDQLMKPLYGKARNA